MKSNLLRSMFVCLLLSQFAFSQNKKTPSNLSHDHYCKTHELTKQFYAQNPNLESEVQTELTKLYESGIAENYKNEDCTDIITVPVVIHYIYDLNNLNDGFDSDAYITNTIMASLNGYFQQQDDVDDNLPPAFQGTAANGVCVEWCLAQYDHPTNAALFGNDINRGGTKDANGDGRIDEGQFAINRYATSASNISTIASYSPGNNQQNLIHSIAQAWPTDEYLNIYVVPDLLDSSTGYTTSGYTYLPNNGSAEFNSIYIDYDFANSGTTIAHECGHWLGLQHVWVTSGCDTEDYWLGHAGFPIDDTYAQNTSSLTIPNSTCGATSDAQVPQSCGSVDNIFNIMDYGVCTNYFTADQAEHMKLCLTQLTTGNRSNFSNMIDQAKCQAPTAPVASFFPTTGTVDVCLGESVSFTDLSANVPNSWSWTFSGSALNATTYSTDQNPSVVPNQAGYISASLTVSNSNGSSSVGPYSVYVNILPSGSPGCPPVNNECFGAIDISSAFNPSCPATTTVLGTFDNTNATSPPSDISLTGYLNGLNSSSGVCCMCEDENNTDNNELHNTLWFKFTPSISGSYNLDAIAQSSTNGCGGVLGTNEDTQLLIYESSDGTCNNLNFFDCNEDGPKAAGANYPAGGIFDFIAGRTYFVIVDEYNFGTLQRGTFCLEVYFNDCSAVIAGCTDPNACNFNPSATNDDGSCNPRDCANGCNGVNTGPAIAGTPCNDGNSSTTNDTYDANCNCNGDQIAGCTDPNACNFNPNASISDGSCNPRDCANGCNGVNTGPAIAGTPCNDGNSSTTNDTYDANCNCSGSQVPGCTDQNACNYNPNATVENGSCNPRDCAGNCSGLNTGPAVSGTACNDGNSATVNDVYDANCNCSGSQILGCTDPLACNYNPNATVENGSCNPVDCAGNCNGLNTGATIPGTACNDGNPATTNDVYDENCICSGNQMPGCNDANACNFNPNATVDDGTCNPRDCAGNCNGLNTGPTIPGTPCNDGNPQTVNDAYNVNCNCTGASIQGCTDPTACNYNPNASIDNNSCNPRDCEGYCNGLNTGPFIPGTPCNDGNPNSIGDVYDENCNCIGKGDFCQMDISMPNAGWHMISTNCIPENDSIQAIFRSIEDDIVQVKNLSGNVYIPAFNNFNNGLIFWDINAGYLVKTNKPTTLQINGQQTVDLNTSYVPLYEGWNLVAYWLTGTADPVDVFSEIADDVVHVKNLSGSYIPAFDNYNSIGKMKEGQSYQVRMSAPRSLYYDQSDASGRLASEIDSDLNPFQPQHFHVDKVMNPNSSTILIMDDEFNPLNAGDEFAVFTSNGVLISSFVYQNNIMGGLVYGKDDTENSKFGFDPDEQYIFKVWDRVLEEVKEVKMQFLQGSPNYLKDDLVILRFAEKVQLGIEDFTNIFNIATQPNPASNEITFKISLDKNSPLTIEVFQLDGRMIDVVVDDFFTIGNNDINYTTDHLTNGLYMYRVTMGSQTFTDKFTIAK